MKTQQNITIKIADVAPISMTIASDTEEIVRQAEYSVNKVWNTWRRDFSDRNPKEVLAMVTFQFAKSYYQLLAQAERQQTLLKDFEDELDRLLDIASEEEKAEQSGQ